MVNATETEATVKMPQPPAPVSSATGFVNTAKEAVEAWKSFNRAPASTARQVTLGLSVAGYVDDDFEPSLLQGYLEAIEQPSEERNGKIYFLWQ